MATKKKDTSEKVIEIKPIEIKRFKVKIVGDTPLIMHKWSSKAKRQMLELQQLKTKTKAREAKKPSEDCVESIYWLTPEPQLPETASDDEWNEAFYEAINNGARYGFPACAFKQSANAAAYRLGWFDNQMGLRAAWFIKPDFEDLVEIHGTPVMREDMVKVGMGTADIRYRGAVKDWWCELTIDVNVNGPISVEQIINNINAGGFCCGVGEWRTERDGIFGRYHVEGING